MDKMFDHHEENEERFAAQEEFLRKLDDRIREQERYTRKNSVIIDNPPPLIQGNSTTNGSLNYLNF